MNAKAESDINRTGQPSLWWKWGLRGASLLVIAVAWEATAHAVDSLLFPTFTEAIGALVELLAQGETWRAVWVSNQALIGGFLLSLVVGIPLGLLLGSSRRAGRIADIYLNTLLVTPIAALIPLFILALGLGLASRILVVFVFAFVVITINTQVGIRRVDPALIEMAHLFGATRGQLWRRVLLPGALPSIVAGVRLGLGRAIAGMVIVELLLIAVGFGSLILRFQGEFESARVYAVVFMVVAEALLLLGLVKRLERHLLRWQGNTVAI
jgi:NitT/TauT family transport system permease protein